MILKQDYNLKLVSYVIGDGNSTDDLFDVINEYKDNFKKIIHFTSDRSVCPVSIPFNNPSIDYNVSILAAEDDLIIRTDPEVLFVNKNMLKYTCEEYEKNRKKLIHFNATKANKEFDPYNNEHIVKLKEYTIENTLGVHTDCSMCLAFSKTMFENSIGGFDERFAAGFCAEDSYLCHYWRTNYGFTNCPSQYYVIHLDHGLGHYNEDAESARWTYSVPLMRRLQSQNVRANLNVDWKRFDMVKNKVEF